MPRLARLVIPGYPHHVTQRGCRRQQTFFCDADYRLYIRLLGDLKKRNDVRIWAYCLMPNHVHLITVPSREDSLAKMIGITHHKYARVVNRKYDWRGHLWQERFHSCVMDESHVFAALRYVELNPVRAGLCEDPADWQWSSARAHLSGSPDRILSAGPIHELIGDWHQYLHSDYDSIPNDVLRNKTNSGRPAGDEGFVTNLETMTGLRLRPKKPGPKSGNNRQ